MSKQDDNEKAVRAASQDPQVLALVGAFQELIKDRAFRGALDALSVEVLALCNEFFAHHATAIGRQCPTAEPEDIVSAVVGWILGMPAGRVQSGLENAMVEAMRHQTLAAVMSGWSMENSRRIHKAEIQ